MLKKIFGASLLLLLLLNTSGCASLQVPDVPLCVEFDSSSGRCLHIVSQKVVDIDETHLYKDKTWWELRPTLVHMPYPAWVEMKTFLIKVCKKKLVDCDAAISSWDRDIEIIDKNVKEKLQ